MISDSFISDFWLLFLFLKCRLWLKRLIVCSALNTIFLLKCQKSLGWMDIRNMNICLSHGTSYPEFSCTVYAFISLVEPLSLSGFEVFKFIFTSPTTSIAVRQYHHVSFFFFPRLILSIPFLQLYWSQALQWRKLTCSQEWYSSLRGIWFAVLLLICVLAFMLK